MFEQLTSSLGHSLCLSHPQAFTRMVQQEPDNGDAWANIAAVHLQHQNWRPAFAAAAEVPLSVESRRSGLQPTTDSLGLETRGRGLVCCFRTRTSKSVCR